MYPILEITDDMLAQIDLQDGTTDEWPDLLGEPTLKTIDFKTDSEYFSTDYDPADLDFAIWLGWHEELDRIYFAGAFVDNEYWGGTGPPFGTNSARDRITFVVDGDHSGPLRKSVIGEGSHRLEIQGYYATPWVSEGPTVIMPWVTHTDSSEPLGDWMIHLPYCEAGGNVIGEKPTIWSMEFFVTPVRFADSPRTGQQRGIRPQGRRGDWVWAGGMGSRSFRPYGAVRVGTRARHR